MRNSELYQPSREFGEQEQGPWSTKKERQDFQGLAPSPETTSQRRGAEGARKWRIRPRRAPPKRRNILLPPERQDEDFQPIAKLVTPNPPEWFREYLHFLYWSVWRISVMENEQLSRAELLQTLGKVKNAAEVLMDALGRPVVLEILGTIRPVHIPKVLYLLMMLRDLHGQARNASQSPILVKMDGRARPGQGRAFAEQTISARTYCALVIVECWKHFNGAYPPPRNRRAAEAAETYWKARSAKKADMEGSMYWRAGVPISEKPDRPVLTGNAQKFLTSCANGKQSPAKRRLAETSATEINPAELLAIHFRRQTRR